MLLRSRHRNLLIKRIGLAFSTLALALSGCSFMIGDNPNASTKETDSSYSNFSFEGDDTETSLSFPKDADGFKQIEEDYFHVENDPSDTKKRSKVSFAPFVEGNSKYESFRMYVGGKAIPIYSVNVNSSQTWSKDAPNRHLDGYASFNLEGKAKVFLQCNFNPKQDVTIRPLDYEVPYEIDNARWIISFEITNPGQYLIESRYRTLHLFVNEMEEYDTKNAIVFKRGIHDHTNDSRISSSNEIRLYSGQHVILEDGAFVRGKFVAYDASNITIEGPGIIDGSTFQRDVEQGIANVPFDISFCSSITISDLAVIDPAGWAFNLYFSSHLSLNNIKIISSRSNGDGISVQSCDEVEVSNSFVRTWDDSLVVKNYVNWRNGSEGSTSNIVFSHCSVVTDLAQSMEIGYETIGERLENVTFEDITVMHAYHKAVMSIHNANNALVKNVTYKNITIEDASMGKGDGNPYLFDFDCSYSPIWSDSHKKTALGEVSGVKVENVKVKMGIEKPVVKITGSLEQRSGYPQNAHFVKDIAFKDVEIYDEPLLSSYSSLKEEYCSNVSFTYEKEATGASLLKVDLSEYGENIDMVSSCL